MKKKILIVIIVMILCCICFCTYLISGVSKTIYYSQIDNSNIEQINSDGGVIDFHGGMSYLYTLTAYDENGNKKNIAFGTSRELKQGAFIQLTVVPVRGVIEWQEVQYNELPSHVQSCYVAP